ncbi:MAG: DUF262 domain-containing protein [Bdellovibrionota bacterium]
MGDIEGKARTVRELLKGIKYSVDYYQREYKWQDKQLRELIDDLTGKFLEDFQNDHTRAQVAKYGHYFLGSIIVSSKDNQKYLVDGQQRLTSLTLLLIYLRNLQKNRPQSEQVNIDELIYSEKFGTKSFNLTIEERASCMEALFEEQPIDSADQPESVQNILGRYQDIQQCFPYEVAGKALPYFIDWLNENVHLVEITAHSDEDAYTIFETMNDRGLSLSPTEMLKGFLLANITDPIKKNTASKLWKDRIHELNELGKEVEADTFKTWLRSQYATKIRERKRGAKPEDFDRIATEFHRWVRDSRELLGLQDSKDYFRFIEHDFNFYSRQYKRLMHAAHEKVDGLEYILYNAQHSFTLQYMLLLAPLNPDDQEDIVNLKLRIVSKFVDILLAWRLWNFRSIAYSTMQYAMFLVMRDIRGLDPKTLAQKLTDTLAKEKETFATNDRLYLHQQNRRYLHRMLARLTEWIEVNSGMPSHYLEYVSDSGRGRYEVEHIWANRLEQHADEFSHESDFLEYRNRIGGLLLLPKTFNGSYGDLPYESKLPHYFSQNLLAKSLNPQCYEKNPGFLQFTKDSGLPFHAHKEFKKADLDARNTLYRQIAERIWNPKSLLAEAGK